MLAEPPMTSIVFGERSGDIGYFSHALVQWNRVDFHEIHPSERVEEFKIGYGRDRRTENRA